MGSQLEPTLPVMTVPGGLLPSEQQAEVAGDKGTCVFLGCCMSPATPRQLLLFQAGLRLHVRLLACGFISRAQNPLWERGKGPEWGPGPLTLLIGSGTFCSGVWTPDYSGSGPGRLPGGECPHSCPYPWGPGPSWHLGDLLLGLMAVSGSPVWVGEVLVASQSHPNHTWHTVGTLSTFVVN